ncbi:IRAK2 [Acrasis kona]|uniref:IRAK2 n=1 Tax=Acrasis kona TaxID=1008807 RepID=A0AAW2ZT54_9EUKA
MQQLITDLWCEIVSFIINPLCVLDDRGTHLSNIHGSILAHTMSSIALINKTFRYHIIKAEIIRMSRANIDILSIFLFNHTLDLFKLGLTCVDPSLYNNRAVRLASELNIPSAVLLLLKDNRVDPSALDNQAVILAQNKKHKQVEALLLGDARVRSLPSSKRVMKKSVVRLCRPEEIRRPVGHV